MALPGTPESRHWNSVVECPLCARSGHCQSYSMTSSARRWLWALSLSPAVKPRPRHGCTVSCRGLFDNDKAKPPVLPAALLHLPLEPPFWGSVIVWHTERDKHDKCQRPPAPGVRSFRGFLCGIKRCGPDLSLEGDFRGRSPIDRVRGHWQPT
jgi:hypothetical protein